MAKINVLEKHIAELIAAGEVVERPSSVVKELTENAIDAGATSVTVEIQNGGITYIRVTDNGCGIAREDVPLAFLRHATSKIAVQEDLSSIETLGFRGEALASICAMARVEVLSRTEEELAGTRYQIEGGDEKLLEDAGCPRGTTIMVRDLFFNTPARMKFLKKDVAEGNAVAGVIDKLALSHPEIAVQFIRDGREVLRTAGDGQLKSAIRAVHGREFVEGLVPVSYRMGAMTVDGFVSKPAAARASRNMQTFFINGRFVKSQTASAAVEQACRGAVMVGKFPACVLHLHIPAEAVDVNVHPAKIEVRFMTERPVFDVVYRAVCDALSRGDAPKEMQVKSAEGKAYTGFTPAQEPPRGTLHDGAMDYIIETPPLQKFSTGNPISKPNVRTMLSGLEALGKSTTKPVIEVKEAELPPLPFETRKPSGPVETVSIPSVLPKPMPERKPEAGNPLLNSETEAKRPVPVPETKPEPRTPSTGPETKPVSKPSGSAPVIHEVAEQQTLLPQEAAHPKLRFAGELFSTYMLLEAADEVVFIDKHAAHERILYEKLRKDTQKQFAQQLLTPVVIRPAREEASILMEHASELCAAGFEIEEFGSGALIVRSAPMAFGEQDVEAALTEIAAHLLSHRTELTTAHEDWILHNVACRAAIKAGDSSDPSELMALAQQLYAHPELRYCPHGRPIYLSMKRRELEKQFGRIQ